MPLVTNYQPIIKPLTTKKMNEVAAIVACAENGVIGFENKIPWYVPADYAYFRRVTINHVIILGRKNYESIGHALPKRVNIVVTRDENYKKDDIIVENSIEKAIEHAKSITTETIFIIGGAEIYNLSYPLLTKLYYTEIHANVKGDTFFIPKDWNDWVLESEEFHAKDEKNMYDYTFKIYNRKK